MTNAAQFDADESAVAEQLQSLNRDAAPVDPTALAKAKDVSLREFESQTVTLHRLTVRSQRESAAGAWTTLIVAVMLVGVSFWMWFTNQNVPTNQVFASVLDRVSDADTLRLKVTNQNGQIEVLVKQPGKVRWNDAPDRYRIADGSRLWRIDEVDNTAQRGHVLWQSKEKPDRLALLDVIGVTVENEARALRLKPVETVKRETSSATSYRAEFAGRINGGERQQLVLEGLFQTDNGRLIELAIYDEAPPVRDRKELISVKLLAMNEAVDDAVFVVAKSLSEDGRIGKVSDVQGVITLRAPLRDRWTPIRPQTRLRPGDWLRTDSHGPNAVQVTLTSGVQITLGPGSLLELQSPHRAKLHQGDVQIAATDAEREFDLLGPNKQRSVIKPQAIVVTTDKTKEPAHRNLFRATRDDKLVALRSAPQWLLGFEGTTTNEKLGALIATIDGRNEPLTVGYHKVDVEIRDQIARTTIEESFKNHTGGRLEGVFHFPLPSDASISGFGMWIGNQLVEADVVEKERAREIYETILRERRDPGLLEWTAGNVFKARVFPIEPHSEKRIKIVYTQVLPLKGNRYRYSYGLQSDLLRQNPVRELAINVLVHSELPLKSVTCPTHECRIAGAPRSEGSKPATTHSSKLEFQAQEFVPQRDFEVVCEVDGRQNDVVVIPHRRGDDGYFLMQLTPPSQAGNWQRELIADGTPLDLLLLCDTSASMNETQRKQQAEFVAAVLNSLSEKDTFNLAGCDVACAWALNDSAPATDESIAKARDFLAQRDSLGWTDLDQAFESVLLRCKPTTQVIYIGDGIVTARDGNPQSFAQRLTAHMTDRQPALHAVTVGNESDAVVLKAIAQSGHGSLRAISGEQGPQQIALELLNELAQPGLTDVKVEFRGLPVAAVYPETLPNIAAGGQQIVLGRYLRQTSTTAETTKSESLDVVVTGRRGTELVRYAAKVSFSRDDEGNSFIPRLWARMHLDHLLAQGRNDFIKEEVIRLSEEFHIITPYTSLLVLETDADRERFGVKRRYLMRDGEQFFADGRSAAEIQLKQQYLRDAGAWRTGMRNKLLRELSSLGRNTDAFSSQQFETLAHAYLGDDSEVTALDRLGRMSGLSDRGGINGPYSGPWGGGMGGGLGRSGGFGGGGSGAYAFGLPSSSTIDGFMEDLVDLSIGQPLDADGEADHLLSEFDFSSELASRDEQLSFDTDDFNGSELNQLSKNMGFKAAVGGRLRADKALKAEQFFVHSPSPQQPFSKRKQAFAHDPYGGNRSHLINWFDSLFPALPHVAIEEPAKRPKPTKWSKEALELSRSLLRKNALKELGASGVEVRHTSRTTSTRWPQQISQSDSLVLSSPKGWLKRSLDARHDVRVEWCDEQELGAYSRAYLLGRSRKSTAADLQHMALELEDHSLTALHESYPQADVRIEPVAGEARSTLIITQSSEGEVTFEMRVLIDTQRHVVLEQTWRWLEGATKTTFDNFVSLHGQWWATKITRTDAQSRINTVTELKITAHDAQQFQQALTANLTERANVRFVHLPGGSVERAKQAVAEGKATVEEHLLVLLHFNLEQQWDKVFEQLAAIEKLPGPQRGLWWLRTTLLQTAGRNEEARVRLFEEVNRIVANPSKPEDLGLDDWLSEHVRGIVYGRSDWNEYLRLLDVLQPVYQRQPPHTQGVARWLNARIGTIEALNRPNEVKALRQRVKALTPWDINLITQEARSLFGAGNRATALALLEAELTKEIWTDPEKDPFRDTAVELLEGKRLYAELVRFLDKELTRRPTSQQYVYARYLSAIAHGDEENRVQTLVRQWMREAREQRGQVKGKDRQIMLGKLYAAISFALGNGHNYYSNRLDYSLLPDLTETARAFARDVQWNVTAQIIGHHQFADRDELRTLRAEWWPILKAEVATLPVKQLNAFVNRLLPNDPVISDDSWKQITAAIRVRWQNETDLEQRDQFAEAMISIYASRFSDSETLPFLRECIATSADERRDRYVSRLFEYLLQRGWTIELERESFELIAKLSATTEAEEREFAQVGAIHRWVDRMLAAREQAAVNQLESNVGGEAARTEQLTRTEYAKKRAEFRRAACEGVANYLIEKRTQTEGILGHWLGLEAAYLDIGLGRNLERAIAECWAILGDRPTAPFAADNAPDDETKPTKPLTLELLKERALTTVINLAARRTAKPADVDRLLKYLDAGIALAGQASWEWKELKFQLLVATDRADELETNLRHWLKSDPDVAPWRQMLAIVLAERGNLPEAIALFELAEKKNELSAADYRQLANWYLVLNRKADSKRALLAEWSTLDEYRIQQYLYAALQPWQRNDQPLPSSLDERVLRAFRAIFKKAHQPEGYVHLLREFYDTSRDFRLLSVVPEAVIGLSQQHVYSMLTALDASVLNELGQEATADKVIEHIRELRAAKPVSNDPALSHHTPTDLRALDLLEAVIERHSSEVLNQPGPHVDAALAALKRAFDREWASGEQRQMADFLASLGNINQPALAAEQMRQLKLLLEAHKPGTEDRIFIAMSLAQCLIFRGQLDQAIAVAESTLRDYQPETWPAHMNDPFSHYIDFLSQAKRFAAAETLIKRHIAKPENEGQRAWMKSQLTSLYLRAFREEGLVSLGEGSVLLKNLVTHLVSESRDAEQHARYQHINELLQAFRTARDRKLEFRELFITFAFMQLPELLATQTDYYESIVSQTTDTLRDVVHPRDAFHFLLVRMEHYPQRLQYHWNNPWQQHGYRLAELRTQAGNLGELEPRLLKLVLTELRRELQEREQYNGYIYRRHSGHFWAEKAADFAKVAEEVAAANKNSGRAIAHVAGYFWHGLDNPSRAIELLFVAHRQGVLHQQGIELLVEALHHTKRYGESIALLEPLVDASPNHLRYRTDLMVAYSETQRREQLTQLLKQTDQHFRKDRRWNEGVAASLGHTCIRTQLNAEATGYLLEAIALHQRHQPAANGEYDTLSGYYRDLSAAYVRIGKTVEAVDAASSAIVLWGPTHTNRGHALEALKQVLREAKDRTAYAKSLDEEALKEGRDRPLIRKSLGRVYFEESKFEDAVVQLKIAAELAPEDRETQQWLLETFDKLGQKDAAIAQVLNMLKYNRRELSLYQQLAERLAEDAARAERAATSMIENLPTETESHTALAEFRQQQDRWEDAIAHWKRVAELRSMEPTGLLRLAEAQLHLEKWDAAESTLQKLSATKWPARFDNDVRTRLDVMRANLRSGRMGM